MRKITVKKLISIMLVFCIMLSTFSVLANAECLGHTDANGDTLCDGCGVQLVAKVTVEETVTYYDAISDAFAFANGQTARIDLLADCDAGAATDENRVLLPVDSGDITFYLNGFVLSGETYGTFGMITVYEGATVTVEAGDYTYSYEDLNSGIMFHAEGGALTVNGGIFSFQRSLDIPLFIFYNKGGELTVNNVDITAIVSNGIVYQYSGNTYINNCNMVSVSDTTPAVRYYNKGLISISGGYYSRISVDQTPAAGGVTPISLVAEGYFPVNNETKNQIIGSSVNSEGMKYISDVVVMPAAATVDGKDFLYIEEAVAYACSLESATVTLNENVTHASPITLTGGNVTFDLNGKSITYTGTTSPSWDVQAGNHKIIKGGILDVGSSSYKAQIADGAELKISQAKLPNGIGVSTGSVVKLLEKDSYYWTGGWVSSSTLSAVTAMGASNVLFIRHLDRINIPTEYTIQAGSDESLEYKITDGGIIYSTYQWFVDGELVEGATSSVLSLKDFGYGTYKIYCVASSTYSSGSDPVKFQSDTCTLSVLPCDTHIENGMDGLCDVCKIQLVAKVNIDGASIGYTSAIDAFAAANGNTATVDLLANSNIGENSITLTSGDITINLNGFMIQSPNYNLFVVKETAKVTVNATGTKYGFNRDMNNRLFYALGGTLIIDGGDFTALTGSMFYVYDIIENNGGNIIINNVTLSGRTSSGNIHCFNGHTEINNCTITADDGFEAVKHYGTDGTVTINGGYYKNIYTNKSTKLTALDDIGEGYYAFDNDTGELITECKDVSMSSYEYSVIENVYVMKPAALVNGTEYYENIQEALDYAATLETATVVLLNDVEHSDFLNFTGGDITFDLNGKTIKYTGSETTAWNGSSMVNVTVIGDGAIDFGVSTKTFCIPVNNMNGVDCFNIVSAYFPNGYSTSWGSSVDDVVADGSFFWIDGWVDPKTQNSGSLSGTTPTYIKPFGIKGLPNTANAIINTPITLDIGGTEPTLTNVTYRLTIGGVDQGTFTEPQQTFTFTEYGKFYVSYKITAVYADDPTKNFSFSTSCEITVTDCPHNNSMSDGYCEVCQESYNPDIIDGVYQISNRGELYWFIDSINEGKISADSNAILLADIGTVNGAVTRMIGTADVIYSGIFDGNGYSIYLDIDSANKDSIGFVRYAKDVTIKNLTLDGTIISRYDSLPDGVTVMAAGAFIGTVIGNCTITDSINCVAIESPFNAGGFIAMVDASGCDIIFERCLNYGKVNSQYGGGFISSIDNGSAYFKDCGNVGEIGNFFGVSATSFISDVDNSSVIVYAENIYNSGAVYSTEDLSDNVNGKNMFGGVLNPNNITLINAYDIYDDYFDAVQMVSAEEIANGSLAYKLNNGDPNGVWKQTIGVDATPVFDGKDVYGNAETAVYFNAALDASVLKHQIRFDKDIDGAYAGTFDFRTIVKIDGVEALCDDVEDIIDVSDGDGIIESGYLFNKNNNIDEAEAIAQINGGAKTYSQINDAYLSSTIVSGSYASACLINNIPDFETESFVSMVYYLKYMQNGVPMLLMCSIETTGQFNVLYNTYYPMAFPNA